MIDMSVLFVGKAWAADPAKVFAWPSHAKINVCDRDFLQLAER
jgi:hypothetical protein